MAMGVPGCPELACCTASMDKVRMVLMLNRSMSSFMVRGSLNRVQQYCRLSLTGEGCRPLQELTTTLLAYNQKVSRGDLGPPGRVLGRYAEISTKLCRCWS